jgi:methanogenic corrinoid protein MtbC1
VYDEFDLQDLLVVNLLNRKGFKISQIATFTRDERSARLESLLPSENEEIGIGKLVYALVSVDELMFHEIVATLVAEHGIELTFSNYLVPFLERIGILWLTDSINTAQEHFISMLIRQRLIVEIDKLPFNIHENQKTALLYLPENEWHELGLLYYFYVLKKNNWRVYYLGQSTPLSGVEEIVKTKNIDLVVSAWVSNFDQDLVDSHYFNVRKLYDGDIAVGGAQSDLFTKHNIIPIKKMEDLLGIIKEK